MFEEHFVESCTVSVSPARVWPTFVSIGLQIAVAVGIIAIPLLHPEALPLELNPPKVSLTLPPKPPVVVQVERTAAASGNVAFASVQTVAAMQSLLPARGIEMSDEAPAIMDGSEARMTGSSPVGTIFENAGSGPAVTVASTPAASGPRRISSGVSQGLLLTPIEPIYPAIAKAARVEGVVIVEAIISRTGTIESLHVVSGPAMLQGAALDAIRGACYQPYRLSGEPTEVQTTISVDFRLSE